MDPSNDKAREKGISEELSIINHPPLELPGPDLLHHLVAAHSEDGAPAIDFLALDDSLVSLSYQSLHQASDVLAARISALAPSRDDDHGDGGQAAAQFIVPLLVPQCPLLYVVQLAILKAGGAFCPLNVDVPQERARFILDDVSARVVITTPELRSRLPAANDDDDDDDDDDEYDGRKLVIITLDQRDLDDIIHSAPEGANHTPKNQEQQQRRCRRARPSDAAYVMYTSGSTGTPKGVPVSHRAVAQSLLAHDRCVPRFSRFLQFAAPTFDVSVFEIFFPLLRGRTVAACARARLLDDLPRCLRRLDADACELTPTVAGSLLRTRAAAPGLRLLLTIGEMLATPVVREFGGDDEVASKEDERDGGRESMLWAMYGPTEASIHCTLVPAMEAGEKTSIIGLPLDTVSAFILAVPPEDDDEGEKQQQQPEFRVLPRGEVGELAVGGPQLADGYLNRPEQTAAAFIDTPYGQLYRTGDQARVRPEDGVLECLGRIASSGQVKLRGQRMEPGEVEQAALRAPGCHGAAAAVADGNILVLFCAVDDDGNGGAEGGNFLAAAEQSVLDSCRAWLPGFMVPGDIVVMRDFPRLASGKVDRRALVDEYARPREGAGAEIISGEARADQEAKLGDEFEQQLLAIARDVLSVEVVRPTQQLRRLGMDSILAIKYASACREAGVEVSAMDVLNSTTIQVLHTKLARAGLERAADEKLQVKRAHKPEPTMSIDEVATGKSLLESRLHAIEAVLPCTPVQASMLAETVANPRAYCNWVELRVPCGHGIDQVGSWFHQLAQGNEILRTGFAHHDGRFVQVIFKHVGDSAIQICHGAPPARDFEMHAEADFLGPVRIRIAKVSDGDEVRVLLGLHHAVYDGWSMDMMLSDLRRLADNDQLPSRPQFRQVWAYLNSSAFEQDCSAAREFWGSTLAGCQICSLPLLRSNVVEAPPSIESTSFSLGIEPSHLAQALRTVECRPQALFQAALAWLWGSILGTDDVLVGSVTSGRTLPVARIEDTMGPFIAAAPLRTSLGQVRTIRDLLESVHAAGRAMLPHAVLPLAEIKKAAGIRPGQPIYDVLFVYQESLYSQAATRTATRGDIGEVARRDYLETKLLVEVEPRSAEGPDAFMCSMTYYSDAFPAAQVELIKEQLRCVMRYMLGHLDADVLSIRAAAFPEKLLSVCNPRPKSFAGVADLARAVEDVAARVPRKDALCFADEIVGNNSGGFVARTLSFEELNARANRVAWLLRRELDVREGGHVAIVMEKSVELYVGILGILKAGCAYVPLLPSTPRARLENILQQADVAVCLGDRASTMMLDGVAVRHLVDLENANLDIHQESNLGLPVDPSRVAYIIFTSGSTGVPKGVCVTQQNMASNLDVLSRVYPASAHFRFLQACSQAFDMSVFEIFFAWSRAMCLCAATNDALFADLGRAIRALRVTHLSMTPTVASLINPDGVPGVEFLVTAGEPLTESVAAQWHPRLFQGYGPCETTNVCTVKRMGAADAVKHLGPPLENTSAAVLARGDGVEAVPLGCLGDLCFGGDQVARGYLKMGALTAAKFIEHPVLGRIYRSGDLGRMLPDGSLVFAGRADEQVKIRGQRIELGEVSAAIRASEEVADCAVLVTKDESLTNAPRLIVFVVPKRGGAGDGKRRVPTLPLTDVNNNILINNDNRTTEFIQALFSLVSSKLPSYMVPSFIVPIRALPSTKSGKLNRDQLMDGFARLGQTHLEMASCSVGDKTEGDDDDQWNDSELLVAAIVSDIFGVAKGDGGLRRWTPLTTLGLDSLSGIFVARQLQQKLGRSVPVSVILQNPSVARLAQVIRSSSAIATPDAQQQSASSDEVKSSSYFISDRAIANIVDRVHSQGQTVKRVYPCTPLQEAMLAASVGKGGYINSMLFRLGPSSRSKLVDSWRVMCARHDILRTCFVTTENVLRPIAQVVLDDWAAPWQEFDASALGGLDAALAQHAGSLVGGVDSMVPPVSFALLRDGDDDDARLLSFVCHHALYDGVAIERLLFEVEQLYRGVELPPAPSYDAFLREALALPASAERFWKDHLAGFEARGLRRSSVESPSQAPHSSPQVLEGDVGVPLHSIRARAKELGVSMLSLCQTAWAAVVCTLSASDDVCFGNVLSGRSLVLDGIDELVAPCFNTVPVRMRLAGRQQQRNVDLVRAFQDLAPGLLRHQFTPLRMVQAWWAAGARARPALFDTLLLLQRPARPLDGEIWTLERDDGGMDVPLVCEVIPDAVRDVLNVKLHLAMPFLSAEALNFAADLLTYALQSSLEFPDSHTPVSGHLPEHLATRLSQLSLENPAQPNNPAEAVDEKERGVWSEPESVIRAVLSTLSSSPIHRIKRPTTIYQLGLDSVGAVQIASMLRQRGLNVTATDVIEHPTCEELARHIHAAAAAATAGDPNRREARPSYDLRAFQADILPQVVEAGGVRADSIENVLPCTPLQAGMLAQFARSDGRDYFNFVDVGADHGVSAEGVARAWLAVFRRHEMLRTGFVPVEHRDCSFAMVQHRPSAEHLLSLTLVAGEKEGFELERWHLDATHAALANLDRPPWRVAVAAREGGGLFMHLAMHHALYDAHSFRVILADVSAALDDGGRHDIASPPPAAVEAAVVEIMSHTTLVQNASASDDFWRRKAGSVVVNAFPTLTPLKEPSREVLVECAAGATPLAQVGAAPARSGYPMQVILQAAWARVLAAYLGEPSVVFGVVLAGRTAEATRDAVFPCITTLPIVATDAAAVSNRALLDGMLRYNTGLFRHQHRPLTRIQSLLGRPDGRLFDTLLAYQKFDAGDNAVKPSRLTVVGDQATVEYPVSIEVEPQGETLKYRVTYFSDVIPTEQARILLRQFDAIVSDLALNPDAEEGQGAAHLDLGLYSMLPAAEPELPCEVALLHQFVEAQATKNPDKTALEFVDRFDGPAPVSRTWTYQQLNRLGNQVAHMLLPLVRTGGIVAVHFDKCPEAFFSILGVLKAGCAFVALDSGAPAARKEFILGDSGALALLTSPEMRGELDFSSVPVLSISEKSLESMPGDGIIHTGRAPEPSDICYCLYTSGTTGTPKGCEITHESTVQAMLAFKKIFEGRWDPASRWLQFASLHFDVSVLEQYWSWAVGITLVGAPRDVLLEDLAATISRLGITHIDLTPSLARLLNPADVPSLCRGVFITGGEQLRQEILDAWGPHAVIYNFYGPTEATIGVTVYPRVPANGRASNIGRQFVNVGAYVLRPGTDAPVLRGGVGELCVSGKLVAKGYSNRDALTAERFPTLPQIGQGGGERVYRTGDLVRVLHDGCFDFLGRADDQVKLRGQRLEIGEINHVVRTDVEDVADVATLVIRNEGQHKDFLVSFVVAATGRGAAKTDASHAGAKDLHPVRGAEALALCQRVRDACRARLPGYMVPTYILQLPFIPLSVNNKAELRELRALFNSLEHTELISMTSASRRHHYASDAMLGKTGKMIARAISALCPVDEGAVTASSNIFELGIDSISVLGLTRILRRAGLPQATAAVILRNSVVGDLVRALDTQKKVRAGASVAAARQMVRACSHRHRAQVCAELGVTPSELEYVAPCSPLQEGMISRSRSKGSNRTVPGSAPGDAGAAAGSYFHAFRFRLAADTSVSRLQEAWQRVVQELPILRTRFVRTTDGLVQAALTGVPAEWTEMHVAAPRYVEDALERRRAVWMEQNLQGHETPVKPVEAVLVRVGRVQAQQGTCRLFVLHIFHGLYDAVSLDSIKEKVLATYASCSSPSSPALSGDQAPTFLEALCHGPLQNLSSSKSFFVEHLKNVSYKPLPSSSGSSPSTASSSAAREIPFSAFEALRTRLGVTHQPIALALWCWTLARKYARDPTIGLVISGRAMDLDGADRVVGPLFNTLPCHVTVLDKPGSGPSAPKKKTWAQLIQACHDFGTAIAEFQHAPLRDIQKWCSGGQPLFDILFSFYLDPAEPTPSRSSPWTEVESKSGAEPDYPLALEATLTSNSQLRLLLVARGDVAAHEDLADMLDHMEAAVKAICEDSDGALWDVEGPAPGHGAQEAQRSTRVPEVTTQTTASPPPPTAGLVFDRAAEMLSASAWEMPGLPKGYGAVLTDGNTVTLPDALPVEDVAFGWDANSSAIREEMASLAGASVEAVDETTALFELGLDSIDMIRLSARLRHRGVALSTSQLMRAQTVAAMELLLKPGTEDNNSSSNNNNGLANGASSTIRSISHVLRQHLAESGAIDHDGQQPPFEAVLPPTPLQDSLVAEMVESGFRRYFSHDVLELAAGVDAARLAEAWRTVIEASPILRTAFVPVESPEFEFAYSQAVCPALPGCAGTTIREEVEVDDKDGLQRLAEKATERARQAGARSELLQLSFTTCLGRNYLVLSIAHALYDGWSLSLLHLDVQAAYEGRFSPRPSYQPYLGEILATPASDVSAFWSGFLDKAPATHLPSGSNPSPPDNKVHRSESLSSQPLSVIKAFCKHRAIATQTLGQACWAALLAARTQSLDVTFGIVLSGRDSEAAQSLLFPTMNTVALRSVVHGSAASWLRYMQENMADIMQFQHFPLRKAQRLAGATGALFNTLFIQQTRALAEGFGLDRQSGEALVRSVDGDSSLEYPVCVEMEVTKEGWVWRVACSGAALSGAETSLLVHQLDRVLGFLLQSADAQVLDIVGEQISVCGLPSFVPSPAEGDPTTIVNPSTAQPKQQEERVHWSPAEEKVRDVLSQVSGVPVCSVHKHHNVYDLGLDSISAIKVSALLGRQGLRVGTRHILRARSIIEIANLAADADGTGSTGEAAGLFKPDSATRHTVAVEEELRLAIGPLDVASLCKASDIDMAMVEEVLPATAMQVHMLSVWQNTDGAVFSHEFSYVLTEPVKRKAVTSAWAKLVEEMPVLRTIFVATRSRDLPIVQVILRASPRPLQDAHDTAGGPTAWSSSESSAGNAQGYVSLAAEPSHDGSWTLRFRSHHALYDGISLPIILARLAELCMVDEFAVRNFQSAALMASAWRRSIAMTISGSARQRRRQFWTEYLGGARTMPFHSPGAAPSQATGERARVSLVAKSALRDVSSLRARCAAGRVGIQALLLAAYARTLAVKFSASPAGGQVCDGDVVFGIYLGNRAEDEGSTVEEERRGGQALPYPTLCLVPLRVRVAAAEDLLALAAQIQEDIHLISLPANVGVGLWEVQDWTGVVVDSFVNFLVLPEAGYAEGWKARLQELPASGPSRPGKRSLPRALEANSVRDVYPDAVDIEASIQGESMAIGVFSSERKIGRLRDAEELVEAIVEVLEIVRKL